MNSCSCSMNHPNMRGLSSLPCLVPRVVRNEEPPWPLTDTCKNTCSYMRSKMGAAAITLTRSLQLDMHAAHNPECVLQATPQCCIADSVNTSSELQVPLAARGLAGSLQNLQVCALLVPKD